MLMVLFVVWGSCVVVAAVAMLYIATRKMRAAYGRIYAQMRVRA